jgi:hypothetical protein
MLASLAAVSALGAALALGLAAVVAALGSRSTSGGPGAPRRVRVRRADTAALPVHGPLATVP